MVILRLVRVALPWLCSAAACAQVSGSIVAESDYRYRGVSLSGGHPALHLRVAYDHPRGLYAGASLTGVELDARPRRAAITAYAGYAQRVAAGWAWEAGATVNHFSGMAGYDYAEAFGGIHADTWSARLSFAPDYLGRGAQTVYVELDSGAALSPALRVFAHVGALTRLSGPTHDEGRRARGDVRLGFGLRKGDVDLQLAWVGVTTGEGDEAAYAQRRHTIVLSGRYEF